jgi:hypothetical protein
VRTFRAAIALLLTVSLAMVIGGSALAVDSATFVFDSTTDPGDVADGPDYNVTGVAPIDDGSGCDAVVMVMVDPTGTPTDVDSFCLALATGLGGSDGDYGSFETSYVPVSSPITYALFDLTAADLAALSGFGDSDQEYFDYVVANATCLTEQFLDETDLAIPAAPAFPLCVVDPPEADAPETADPGETITVEGVGCPPGPVTAQLLEEEGSSTVLASGTTDVTATDDPFEIEIAVPDDMPGGEAVIVVFCGEAEAPLGEGAVLSIAITSQETTTTTASTTTTAPPAPPAQPVPVNPNFTG